jgi:hypothetical protein
LYATKHVKPSQLSKLLKIGINEVYNIIGKAKKLSKGESEQISLKRSCADNRHQE